jgi:hypothetical protein
MQTNGNEIVGANYNVQEPMTPLVIRSKEWLTSETEILKAAVGRIPREHRNMLSKLKFIRMETLPGSAGKDAVAEYYPTEPPVICISDRVVDPNYGEYLYDKSSGEVLPGAVRKIIHEVGHAVSFEKWRQAALKYRNGEKLTADEQKSMAGSQTLNAPTIVALDEFIARGEYVTDYAAMEVLENGNKPNARSELFAEAYSLWITNRSYMENKHPKLAAYFAALKF